MEDSYAINLEVFEGPLDLLLHLIKKNEVDIYDIPIVDITNQYNAYLAKMEELNLNIAGEFILMASTLVQIKSKTLLPKHEHEEESDPRDELVQQLIEHQLLKEMAGSFHQIQILREHCQPAGRAFRSQFEEDGEVFIEADIYDLIASYKAICDRFAVKNSMELERATVTVAQQVQMILIELNLFKSLILEDLFEKLPNRLTWIVTFLALLELVRLKFVKVFQGQVYGVIRLFRAFEHLSNEEIQAICNQFGQ